MKKDNLIGIGAALTLTLIFTTLKALNLIGWSWIWVTSPIWFPPFAMLLLFAIYVGMDIFGPEDPEDETKNNI